MKKVEANYAVVPECSNVRKDWRATIFNILIHNWWKRKKNIQQIHMKQEDKRWRCNWRGWYYSESTFLKVWRLLSTTEEFDCWKKNIFHKKSTTWRNNKRIHHTIEELIIYMWIWRCQRKINLVQTGRWHTKRQNTRHTSKKRSRLDT